MGQPIPSQLPLLKRMSWYTVPLVVTARNEFSVGPVCGRCNGDHVPGWLGWGHPTLPVAVVEADVVVHRAARRDGEELGLVRVPSLVAATETTSPGGWDGATQPCHVPLAKRMLWYTVVPPKSFIVTARNCVSSRY